MGPKKIEKILDTKNLSIWKKYCVWTNIGSTKIFGQKEFTPKQIYWAKKCWAPKNFGLKKYFGSEKDFWFEKFWSTEIKALKKLGPKSLVKVGSVTVEILLIWTNVARTYVAWTNVTMESVLDVPMSLHLKFHQNRVSNSWDIANIEFLWWWWWGGLQSHFRV